jgi:hypothetical protein
MRRDTNLTREEECFKVVFVNSHTGEYFSSHEPLHQLQYCIGKKTVPVFGKIFVFKDYNDAELLSNMSFLHCMIVLRCIGNDVRRIYKISCNPHHDRLFWELKKRKKSDPSILTNVDKNYKCYVSDYVIPLEIVFDNKVERKK